jgi:hypothetical protein
VSAAKKTDIPPEYYRACSELVDAVVAWGKRTGLMPRFRMPPEDVTVIVTLSGIVDRVALNDAARDLVAELNRRPVPEATLAMLEVALKVCGVPVERVALDELGIQLSPKGVC